MANLLATNPCEMNCLFLPLRQSHVRLAVQREDAMTSLLAVNLCEKQPDLQKTHKRSRLWIHYYHLPGSSTLSVQAEQPLGWAHSSCQIALHSAVMSNILSYAFRSKISALLGGRLP